MRRVLFICSRNRLRSPTAEEVFRNWPELEVSSVGLAPDAEEVVTPEMLDGVDLIVVMERQHRNRLRRRFGNSLRKARIVCLDIPDRYGFMDPELVGLLEARATPHLEGLTASKPRAAPRSPRRA